MNTSAVAELPDRRLTCTRCLRPVLVCVCSHVPSLSTVNTNVVLLQHPRESRNGIGTARLAHLALPGSLLKAGLDFSHDADVQATVTAAPTFVLFPGENAIPISALPATERITLVVVDGTWWQAKKLIKLNPWLAALPRVAFSPTRPSDYRIRRQPAAHCVSTIEALAEVLSAREPAGKAFETLRDPFRAMVELQVRFQHEVSSSRHRSRSRPRDKRRATLPERLAPLWPRLVFVQGEANSWPARHPERPAPELVHWVAQRAAEPNVRFEAIVAPRSALAPSTARYVELSATQLAQGESLAQAQARWRNFVRADDIFCAWGPYHLGLAQLEGWGVDVAMAESFVDMRNALSQHLRLRLSLVEDGVAALNVSAPHTEAQGRAHRRLAALQAVANTLMPL